MTSASAIEAPEPATGGAAGGQSPPRAAPGDRGLERPSRFLEAFRNWVHTGAEQRWLAAFVLIEIARFAQIFVLWGPMDHVFSDPARHLDNARHFLKPGPMGCSNPYFYQLFLFVALKLTGEKRLWLHIMNATLCALHPYIWYRFAKLTMKARVNALRFGFALALVPSQAVIFQYFMNETMILPLLGASLWATAAAAKRRSGFLFIVATVLWVATILTRSIAVPLSIFALGYALFHMRSKRVHPMVKRGALAGAAVAIAGASLWIAGQHSLPILEYATPFGDNPTASLYLVSGAKIYETSYTKPKHWTYTYGFSSPSLYINPFYPFKGYETIRKGTFKYTTNVETHAQDLKDLWWQQLKQNKSLMPRLIWENIIVLAFGHTWPESGLDNPQGRICLYERWIWAPATVLALYMTYRYMRRRRELRLVPTLTWFAIAALYGSQLVVMEGRYRKPIEPIVFLGIAWVLDAKRKTPAWKPA